MPGYEQVVSPDPEKVLSPSGCTTNKVIRRFAREKSCRTAVKPKEKSAEEKRREEAFKRAVREELVYPYTTDTGEDMVEVHVDLLSQAVRSQHSTKLKIHGIEFDMGGNLSVRFPPGETIVIKVGTDEVVFKVTSLSLFA